MTEIEFRKETIDMAEKVTHLFHGTEMFLSLCSCALYIKAAIIAAPENSFEERNCTKIEFLKAFCSNLEKDLENMLNKG